MRKALRGVGTLAVTAAMALAALTLPAKAQATLRLISGWTPNTSMVQVNEAEFVKRVAAASNGKVAIQRSGPEVVPPFEQLQPLSAGVFDLMFTTANYHQAQTGVGAVIDGLLKNDTKAIRDSGVFDFVNDYYTKKFGVTLLALVQSPENHVILREPLGADGTLAGRKIRTNAAFEGIVRGLGGAPIGMSPADAYAAMEKGVLNGIAFPMHVSADFKLYEVGKFMTRPGFGHSTLILMANAQKFSALPADVQALIRDEARRMEEYGTAGMAAVALKQNDTMKSNGVKETEFAPAVAAKLKTLFVEGGLAVANKSDPAGVKAVVDLARSKGVLNE